MNSTSRHRFFGSNISRPWQCAGLLASVIFFTGIAHAQVTIGDPLVDGSDDGNSGGVYLYTGVFGEAGTADTWSFYDDEAFLRKVTPLLFQKTDSSTFVLTGVGTTVSTTASGEHTGNNFGLIAGSDSVGADYTFGFTDREVSYSGSGNAITTDDRNGGVVDFQSSGGSWAFVPSAQGNFNLILGQEYVIDAPIDADHSIVSLYVSATRQYSAQMTTSAVPEPATVAVWMGLAALIGTGLIRRHHKRTN